MNPVLPGLAIGRGSSVSGFRGYMDYGICFVLAVTSSLFIRNRQEVCKLIKWMGIISVVFVAIFVPLTFSKSYAFANAIRRMGLGVGFFDNGWLRFIVLPGFGLLVVILTLLPGLFPLPRFWRILL